MTETHIPAAAVVRVVARENIQIRVDARIENVARAPAINFHVRAIGPDAHDAAATPAEHAAIRAHGLGETEVAHGNINPAVDAHADAVGSVVRAALGDVIRADAVDEPLLFIGHAVAIGILVQCKKRRVQHPQFSVVVNEPARVVHLGECVHLVRHAVAVGIEATHHAPASLRLAERALLINAHKQLARGRGREANGIIYQRRFGEQRDAKPFRRLQLTAAAFIAAILRRLHRLARQLRQRAGVRFEFPEAAPVRRRRAEESDFKIPRTLRVHLVRRDLLHLAVVRLVDQQLPLLAVSRPFNLIPVCGVGLLPKNAHVLNILRLAEIHLQPLALAAARRAPARGWIAIGGQLREVALGRFLRTGGRFRARRRVLGHLDNFALARL